MSLPLWIALLGIGLGGYAVGVLLWTATEPSPHTTCNYCRHCGRCDR